MYKEPRPMREIYQIQEKIFKENRLFSDKKKLERLIKEAAEAKMRFGLKLRKAFI